MSARSFDLPCRMGRTTFGRFGCVILSFYLLAGCSKEYETAPVSGCVTLDGKPLADVGITFVPLAKDKQDPNIGPGSLGKTDQEGRFTLRTVEGDKGAVPTEHIVRMSTALREGEVSDRDELAAPTREVVKSALPRNAQDGTLRYTVPAEGTDQANFDLTSEPVNRSR